MKYILPLLLVSSPLLADIEEKKINRFLQEKIDEASYQYSHTENRDNKFYYRGYMDAMNNILYMTSHGKFD